ncbi:MAG: family 10 glycosylhydrolase, partial [Clostridia bacterium]
MRKIKFIICLLISVVLVVPFFNFNIAAADTQYFQVSGVNVSPKTNAITVFTSDYHKSTTGIEEGINHLEIVVSNDTITKIDGTNNKIPKNGYVIIITGTELQDKFKKKNPQKGDKILFDAYEKKIHILNSSYNPYFEVEINFDGYNGTRTENIIKIYNSGESSGTNIWGSEVVVNENGFVSAIGGNNNTIPKNGFVISAVGKERISELNNAAQLGMSVVVDESAKKIKFICDENTILNKMTVKYNNSKNFYESQKALYKSLDYDKLNAYLEKMSSSINLAKKSKIYSKTALIGRDFDVACKAFQSESIENPAVEARAMWLRPIEKTREQINAVVKNVYQMGYNIVCLELLYDSTTIFPVDSKEYLFSQNPSFKGFDVLAAYIEECHKYGIEVHGWMSCLRVGYESSKYESLSVAAIKKDWRCIAKSGIDYVKNEYGNGYFLNPALPEVKELLLKFYKYIFENYSLDAFQLDYIRYPYAEKEDYGYDNYTLELFETKYGINPKNMTSSDEKWLDWCKFRAGLVTTLVKEIAETAEKLRPDMYVAADVAPDFSLVYSKYMQESEKWLSEDIIDIGLPMAYGTNVIPIYAPLAVKAAGDHAYAFIGLGDYGVDILKRQILESRNAGGDGFAFFSYSQYLDGNYKNAIKSTILSKRALSPTFNSTAALREQLKYLTERCELICKSDPNALSLDNIDVLIDCVEKVFNELKTGLSQKCITILEETKTKFQAENCDEKIKQAFLSDISKALKIA